MYNRPGGGGTYTVKLIGMLVVFFRIQNSDFVFLGCSGKSRGEMKFWYFLWSAHFLH